MGKPMDKAKVIYGEHKAVTLKEFGNLHEREVSDIVRANTGPTSLGELSWHLVREKQKLALADEAMATAHVKIGVIAGDLVWRAKAAKFAGKKEYDALLFKHYAARVAEQDEFAASLGRDMDTTSAPPALSPDPILARRKSDRRSASEADEGEKEAPAKGQPWEPLSLGKLSRAEAEKALGAAAEGAWLVRISTKEGAVASYRQAGAFHHQILGQVIPRSLGLQTNKAVSSAADFQALLALGNIEQLKSRAGYFNMLSADAAKEKLDTQPPGAWLIRGSSQGGVTWSYRSQAEGNMIKHIRLVNKEQYDRFIKATKSRAALQVTP